jgi:hypothetical protein
MNLKHKLRSGKHAGKTIEEVLEIEPGYIEWVENNRPEMLKSFKEQDYKPKIPNQKKEEQKTQEKEEQKTQTIKKSKLEENWDFLNQGPHRILNKEKNKPNE